MFRKKPEQNCAIKKIILHFYSFRNNDSQHDSCSQHDCEYKKVNATMHTVKIMEIQFFLRL